MTRRQLFAIISGSALVVTWSNNIMAQEGEAKKDGSMTINKVKDLANTVTSKDWEASMKNVSLSPTFEKRTISNEPIVFTVPTK